MSSDIVWPETAPSSCYSGSIIWTLLSTDGYPRLESATWSWGDPRLHSGTATHSGTAIISGTATHSGTASDPPWFGDVAKSLYAVRGFWDSRVPISEPFPPSNNSRLTSRCTGFHPSWSLQRRLQTTTSKPWTSSAFWRRKAGIVSTKAVPTWQHVMKERGTMCSRDKKYLIMWPRDEGVDESRNQPQPFTISRTSLPLTAISISEDTILTSFGYGGLIKMLMLYTTVPNRYGRLCRVYQWTLVCVAIVWAYLRLPEPLMMFMRYTAAVSLPGRTRRHMLRASTLGTSVA